MSDEDAAEIALNEEHEKLVEQVANFYRRSLKTSPRTHLADFLADFCDCVELEINDEL